TVNVGLGYSKNQLQLIPGLSPLVFFDQINQIGHETIRTTTLNLSYGHDTLNAYFKPTRGGIQTFGAEIALPGATVQYYKISASTRNYFELPKGFVGVVSGAIGYGKTYGNSSNLSAPFADSTGQIR